MMDKSVKLVLASGSPRRKEIMEKYGFSFNILTAEVEEVTKETKPEEIVKALAYKKALAVAEKCLEKRDNPVERIFVVGSDTIVAYEERILGKPRDRENATEMIAMLQGKTHQVYTGVALVIVDEKIEEITFAEKTDVIIKPMTKEEIMEYVASGESDDKAGAYAIQGIFSKYIEGFDGDYYNVVGLPIDRLWVELEKAGYPMPERSGI